MPRQLPKPLLALVALSFCISALYAFVNPHYEAPDELSHYPMVQYLATHGLALPPQDPAANHPWHQEGSQPPLYYLMVAVLTSPIPQDDLALVRREYPLALVGQSSPDGGMNLMIHSGEVPTDGGFLATRVARLFSAVLGALTVAVTFYTAKALFPERPELIWGAAGFNAVLPMFAFISGSVNNDNLSNLLGNLTILLLIRLVLMTQPPGWKWYAGLGLAVGGGILSKLSMGFAIPMVAVVLLLLSIRFRDWKPLIIGGLISGGLTVLIAGWWYLRNAQLYGDPTGLSMFLKLVGERPVPLDLAGVLRESAGFNQTFWGLFGSVNVVMPDVFYMVYHIVTLIGIIGGVGFWLRGLLIRRYRDSQPPRWWIAAGISVGWILVTLLACIRWTSITPASQGRLTFVALSSISLWLMVGLTIVFPARFRRMAVAGGVSILGIISILTPFLVIAPAYALPPTIDSAPALVTWSEPDAGGQIALIGQSDLPAEVVPATYVQFDVDFEVAAPLSQDYALFVHILTPDGVIVAQRDAYPGRGLMATRDLPAGRTWRNPIAVYLPPTLHTDVTLDVRLGWFNLSSGARLVLSDGEETLSLGQMSVPPQIGADGIPNPIQVEYGFGAQLVGYQVSALAVAPGDSFDLTLVWQTEQAISRDYTLTVQLIEPRTAHKAAASDLYRPTSTWRVGESITETMTLTIGADAPPGQYALRVAWYIQDEAGQFIMQPVMPTYQTAQMLTPMRVLTIPPQ